MNNQKYKFKSNVEMLGALLPQPIAINVPCAHMNVGDH